MADQLSTPRITASYLESFVGRVVMLVGKVTQLMGNQATLDSDGIVTVILNHEAHLTNGNAAQVIGKVNPDLSIKVLSSSDLGAGLDHGRYNNLQQPSYIPHVAMVWSSPPMTPSPPHPNCQNAPFEPSSSRHQFEHSNSQTFDSRLGFGSSHLPARQLRRVPSSFTEDSRPSTAESFATSSSDLIFSPAPRDSSIVLMARPLSAESFSQANQEYAPSEEDVVDTLTQEFANFGSLSTIPSAQPISPRPSPSPLEFSLSPMPGGFPSPPLTQPQYDRSFDFPISSAEPFPSEVPRQLRDSPNSEADDSELLYSVVDGIARLHVAMERDDAGRWRIRRLGGAEDASQ